MFLLELLFIRRATACFFLKKMHVIKQSYKRQNDPHYMKQAAPINKQNIFVKDQTVTNLPLPNITYCSKMSSPVLI